MTSYTNKYVCITKPDSHSDGLAEGTYGGESSSLTTCRSRGAKGEVGENGASSGDDARVSGDDNGESSLAPVW